MSCRSAAYSSHSRSRSVRPWIAARLIEQRDREPRDLLRVLGPVVAALGELEDAAAADVGIAIGLRDLLAVPRDVVEHQPFAQRQIAQRDLGRRRAGAGSCRAGSRRRPRGRRAAARARARAAASRGRARRAPCGRGASAWRRRGGCAAARRRRRPSAADATAPRLRIVPDVPITRSKPARAIWSRYLPSSASMCRTSLRSSRGVERIALDEPLGQPDDAELEAAAELDAGAGAARDLDAAAADVDDDRDVARRRRRRRPRPDG